METGINPLSIYPRSSLDFATFNVSLFIMEMAAAYSSALLLCNIVSRRSGRSLKLGVLKLENTGNQVDSA